ncbi:hypothetical protein [Jidongwangia harbinensis]|uniref:hypothetical protein n=1 Tax=Jidongwangia harbinensis TaxID=2878561 RepID=UPI001CD92F1C|nr:hypothetical protein [Jidongwangia harbinensis]MCA2212167.1 hypothetical protein [Jidongwangia harbinensis]
MTRYRGTWAAAAVALSLLAGCARTAADGVPAAAEGGASSAPSEVAADAVVLRVRHEGGFVPVDMVPGRVPTVSVYGDGRVITQGPQLAIYPGPALPNLQVQQLDPARVADLLERAVAAGVRSGTDFGRPGVADAPATRVDVRYAGRTYSVAAEALQEAQADDPRLTEAQRAARTKLAAFVKELNELPTAPGMPPPQPYRAESVAALARPYTRPADGLPAQPDPVAWPGPALPGEYLTPQLRLACVTATGAQAEQVLAAAAKANAVTPWTSGGDRFTVTFRPLLPDESDCADLKAAR